VSYFFRTKKQDEIESVMKGGTSEGAVKAWETRRNGAQDSLDGRKTISRDTPILPLVVADRVTPIVAEANRLAHAAHAAYRTDPEFAKKVRASGNKGRDFLHKWMKDRLKTMKDGA
jgi:hypothetical protein